MIYKSLGGTGLKVSALSLGSGMSTLGEKVDSQTFEDILHFAFENGVNLIDTAENYGMGKAASIIGNILKRTNFDRSSYVLLSKVFFGGRAPNQLGLGLKRLRDSCDKALRDLNTDYLDIFLCHSYDKNTPLDETIFGLHNLILSGKILYWGTSNWSAEQILDAVAICKSNGFRLPAVHQPCYNLMTRKEVEEFLNPIAIQNKIGFTTYSPLNCGYLTGKYSDSSTAQDSRFSLPRFQNIKSELLLSERATAYTNLTVQLKKISKELDCTMSQLAIAWCLKNPQVASVILGVTSKNQMAENLGALGVVEKISTEVMGELEQTAIEMPL